MVFKKGHKSHALRLLGLLLGLICLVGAVAYFVNSSTEQTSKVSFKAAGMQYKKHFTFTGIRSLPDVSMEGNQRKNTSSPTSSWNDKSQNSTNKSSLTAETKQVKKSTIVSAEKPSDVKETVKTSSDLQVFSSFDCVKSIPTALVDYISNMFLNEYRRSHKDFHSQQRMEKTIPLLKQLSINCGIDQNCSTLFQYDKQYGSNTTADNTYQRKEVFYCCPSVYSSTNESISKVCKGAQSHARKSVFRESKSSTFLGWVIELVGFAIVCNLIEIFIDSRKDKCEQQPLYDKCCKEEINGQR